MKKGQIVPTQIKELIIQKVKEGIPISQLGSEYDVYPNTIRRWCRVQMQSGSTSKSDALLVARLQKQNRELMEIIGELTLENRVKKNSKFS
jgi:transposase-like protein